MQPFCIRGKHPRPFAKCYEEKGWLPAVESAAEFLGMKETLANEDRRPASEITVDQYSQLKARILFLERKLQEHITGKKSKRKRTEGVPL